VIRVRALLKGPAVTCSAGDSIGAAARLMTGRGVDAAIVLGATGRPDGIVTDRDLRERVLAAGRSADEPVGGAMTTPVVSISPEASLVDAVLEMTRLGLHHLAVVEAGELLGVVSGYDFLHLHAAAPVQLARMIRAARTLDELAPVLPALAETIRRLFVQGLSGSDIGRIVSELNDHLTRQVLAIAESELRQSGVGEPPVAYCWLALGSEGRSEQTIKTDQDNALIYDDPRPALRAPSESYFSALATRAIAALVELGHPPCPAGFMASTARWRQPLGGWRAYVREWIGEPLADRHLLYASTCFDFRAVAGSGSLARALRDEIRSQARAWRSFPRHLAKVAVSHAPPLGLFGRLLLERRNGGRGIDIKLNGLMPLVNALRVHAIELGLEETNTLERLAAATSAGRFTEAEAEATRRAYETLFHLRLGHQLGRISAGRPPDNFLDPRGLLRDDQRRLKEAFRAIRHVQGKLEMRYFTEPL
jgi:CBS domain-containing protein